MLAVIDFAVKQLLNCNRSPLKKLCVYRWLSLYTGRKSGTVKRNAGGTPSAFPMLLQQ